MKSSLTVGAKIPPFVVVHVLHITFDFLRGWMYCIL